MTKRKKKAEPVEVWPKVSEGFGDPEFWIRRWSSSSGGASCFNGAVEIHRYRVTVEKIEEPIEVIHARLTALWEASDNHHHCTPLRSAAAKVGLELPHDTFGAWNRKGRKHGTG